MIPAESRVFTSPVRAVRADYATTTDFGDGKWPVWLRLVTIVGLSAGLWGAIIWAVMTAFR